MNPLPTPDTSRAVAYRRVSSAEQVKGYGLDVQARAIRAFAKSEGLEVVADHAADERGALPLDERPGLQAALASALQHGAGTLLVPRRDRLAREEFVAHDALRTFRGAGVRVLYADGGNPGGESAQLLDSIQHAMAADDRRRSVARMRAGALAKMERHPQSRALGGKVPFGYRRTRTGLEADPERADQVRRIFDLIRSGRTIREVAKVEEMQPTQVARIVKREDYKREPRIIDPRVWNAAQRALAGRRKR